MKVGMIGMGKLGLPVALAIESRGHDVVGYDINPDVQGYLDSHEIPYQEEGLQPLLESTGIKVAKSIGEVVAASELVFLAIQTPHDARFEGVTALPEERADFDYTYLKDAVTEVADSAQKLGRATTLAVISTCLPGTFNREIEPLLNEYVDYVYTPQFIAMGTVLNDYLNPEFDLIGVHDESAAKQLQEFYATINDAPHVTTDISTAEGIKVSYNTWITAKTVVANTWGEIAHKTGMNFEDIKKAWDLSTRRLLSSRYTDAGVGDGGGCHPRDNIAMSWLANEIDLSHNLFEDLMSSREDHMAWIGELARSYSRPVVILGREFKPETNITTGSSSVLMYNILSDEGAEVYWDGEYEGEATYVIGCKHEKYATRSFPKGSVVIDPFRYIPRQNGVTVVPIGGK